MALAVRFYLLAGAALIAVHLAVGGSLAIYEGVGLSASVLIFLGAAWYRPPRALGWLSIGLSQSLAAFGDILGHLHTTRPFPGPPDIAYLVSFAAFAIGVFLLMGRNFPWRDWEANLDALLITACLAFTAWMLFFDRADSSYGFTAAGLITLAYPLFATFGVALMIRIGLLGDQPVAYWLLLASILPLTLADGQYVQPALNVTYHFGSWVDAAWLGSYVLCGAAALDPSLRRFARSRLRNRGRSSARGVIAGGIGLVALRVVDRYDVIVKHRAESVLLGAGQVLIVIAVVARVLLYVRELNRQRVLAEDSERRFRLIFERAPIGISFGRDGVMSDTNPALHRMLGYSAAEFAERHYLELTHPDDRDLDMQAQMDTGRLDHFSVDKRYVKKDGGILYAHVNIALEPDTLGVSLIEDVTQRRELEEQLRQSQKMDAIGKLAGGIAHDFNNLMTAVLGYSDLLLAKLNGDESGSREKIEGIRDAAMRASDLTRQLLAFGRRQMLEMRDVDMRDVVVRSESLLRRLIGEDIKLDAVVAPEPVVVHADPTQLDQVVINLAVNAREAMPDGGTLTIVVTTEDGNAVLAVGDTGVGMDEETRDRIFEPFFTTKPFGEGTGLGLSTVDGIVAQSGGTIGVSTTEGSGTVFTVRLPLVEAPATVPVD
ncbi:MAG TPA: ATP-binding protein [Gaiellaceae bacterium]|nr:ATP-binding protein [Gaiellaceae bacterium]